ncbi:hypothetical protein Tco_0926308 [Tanacetum coccineum]|uniref:Uncharacterized protein n=1 Tax=Tanacetum coccineum TaxID=301880 RepID=A0ABQ5DGG4_9ASTR
MESQSETTQTVSALKLPVLKTWRTMISGHENGAISYLTDYALWGSSKKNEIESKKHYVCWPCPDEVPSKFMESDAKNLMGSNKPGGHASKREKSLKKTGRSEFSMAKKLWLDKDKGCECYNCHRKSLLLDKRALRNQGIRKMEMVQEGMHQWIHLRQVPCCLRWDSERDRTPAVDRDMFVMYERERLNVSIMRMLRLKEVARKTVGTHLEFAPDYAFSDSLLLTPLCYDDIHDVTPCVSALTGCDRLVSEPLVIENILVMFSPTRKKSRWGTVFPTGLKRYKEPLVEPKEIG